MKPGDIYWVDLPPSQGREQAGRRPAIVLQDDGYAGGLPLFIAVPLTTAAASRRFAGTVPIPATADNGLSQDSVALVFQLRALDRRRLRERIGTIGAEALATIYHELDRLTGHQPPP